MSKAGKKKAEEEAAQQHNVDYLQPQEYGDACD